MKLNVDGLGLKRQQKKIVNFLLEGPKHVSQLHAHLYPTPMDEPLRPLNAINTAISAVRNKLDGSGWRIRRDGMLYHLEPGPRLPREHPSTRGVPRMAARVANEATIPAVRQLFDIIDESGRTMTSVAKQSLVSIQTLGHWRQGSTFPYMRDFYAVADVMGYDIILKKRE